MKNKLIKRMYIILVITVIAVATGVFITVFGLSYNATMKNNKDKAIGVRDFVLESITFDDLNEIDLTGDIGDRARAKTQEKLNLLLGVGNFRHLYIGVVNEFGDVITTLSFDNPDGTIVPYVPSGALYSDLRNSLNEGTPIAGSWMYRTDFGRVYSIFWPIVDRNNTPIAALGMEFNVDSIYLSLKSMVIYSLFFSLVLISIFSVIAYLSMNKVSEPFYKKMVSHDFLTGLRNRLSYEERLTSCESLILKKKSITIVIFDINYLKMVNETFGHKRGDSYIINTTKIISEHIDGLGELYRIGGDEFAAIIIGHHPHDIYKLVNALRKENRPVLDRYVFSCAYGAATYSPDVDNSLNALAKRAEDEMLMEKVRQKALTKYQ